MSRLVRASAAPAGTVVARRSAAAAMEQRADKAEADRANLQARGPTSDVAKLSVVEDVADAERLRKHLAGSRIAWEEALDWKRRGSDDRGNDAAVTVTEAMRDQNENAIVKLDDYVVDAQRQRGGLKDFKAEASMLERDHERLVAQIVAYAETEQGGRTLEVDDTAIIGAREVASAGIKAGEFRSVVTSEKGATAATHQEAADQWGEKMRAAGQAIGNNHTQFRGELHTARAAAADLEAVIAKHAGEAKQEEIDAKLQPASNVQDTLTLIGDLVGNIVGLTGWLPEGAKGDSRAAGAGSGKGAALLLMKLIDQREAKLLETQVAQLRDQLGMIKNQEHLNEYRKAFQTLEAAKIKLLVRGQEFIDAHRTLGETQDAYRRSMSEMGASADVVRGRGDRFEVLAQLLAEADAYVARADATLTIGRDEIAASSERKQSAAAFDISGDTPGVEFHELVVRYKPDSRVEASSYTRWVHVRRHGFDVTDTTMEHALEFLQTHRASVRAHADQLRKAFTSRKP